MHKPAWAWTEPVIVPSVSSSHSVPPAPDLLVTHSACSQRIYGLTIRHLVVDSDRGVVMDRWTSSDSLHMQCALPIWLEWNPTAAAATRLDASSNGTTASRFDVAIQIRSNHSGLHADSGEGERRTEGAVVLSERTAFFNEELMGEHFSHFLMNWLIPNVLIWDDMGGRVGVDRRLGLWGSKDKFDSSAVSGPYGMMKKAGPDSPGHDIIPAGTSIKASCFQRTVFGAASVCPLGYCDRVVSGRLLERARTKLLGHYAIKPDPRPPHRRPRLKAVILVRRGTRVIQNSAQVADILRTFPSLGVELLELKQPSIAEQAAMFVNASLLVSPHGNALGNTLWMPRGATVVEVLPDGLTTAFFEELGRDRLYWKQVWCEPEQLDVELSRSFIDSQLKRLVHVCPWLVRRDTRSDLLEIQQRINRGVYTPSDASSVSQNTTADLVNRTPNRKGECQLALRFVTVTYQLFHATYSYRHHSQ